MTISSPHNGQKNFPTWNIGNTIRKSSALLPLYSSTAMISKGCPFSPIEIVIVALHTPPFPFLAEIHDPGRSNSPGGLPRVQPRVDALTEPPIPEPGKTLAPRPVIAEALPKTSEGFPTRFHFAQIPPQQNPPDNRDPVSEFHFRFNLSIKSSQYSGNFDRQSTWPVAMLSHRTIAPIVIGLSFST